MNTHGASEAPSLRTLRSRPLTRGANESAKSGKAERSESSLTAAAAVFADHLTACSFLS